MKKDIVVIGAGHAGIEAAIISAKMGMSISLVTLNKNKIGLMSCNPAIGGLAKGQLVREIDALGGAMGKIIDEAGIHFKMLNTSKGPAVQSPRAQADRAMYAKVAQKHISEYSNIEIVEDAVIDIIIKDKKIEAVRLAQKGVLPTKAVILTAGTFLNGLIHVGTQNLQAGRAGDIAAVGISESLVKEGFRTGRLKTGTPPRIAADSIDYTKIETQAPDAVPQPFSFSTKKISREQINCYIAYTNNSTHEVLREGFKDSPMFSGRIKAKGPRYCPSIEDKIDRFADKNRHQLFLEPEGYSNNEVYVNGFSTSLPGEIQERAIRTVPGLENVKILRLGYAVEYDFFPPDQVNATMETKLVTGLYFAGQINGTSGYEEAAAQGLMAGYNASLSLQNKENFVLKRSEAYIGVLVDDLINKVHEEPYRMFTSRAEFRLLLRHDNADLRLMKYAQNYGVLEEETFKRFQERKNEILDIEQTVLKQQIDSQSFNTAFADKTSPITKAVPVSILLKRPEVTLRELLVLLGKESVYSKASVAEVEFSVKYKGYLDRQNALIQKFVSAEKKLIPDKLDYTRIMSLSSEAREKLQTIRPKNFGQASRISGVRFADLSVLMIYVEKFKQDQVSRGT